MRIISETCGARVKKEKKKQGKLRSVNLRKKKGPDKKLKKRWS